MEYLSVKVDENKPKNEYKATARRADLFRKILEFGHPRLLNQTEQAEIYGVTQKTISKDINKIKEEINKDLSKDAKFTSHVVYNTTIKKLMQSKSLKDNVRGAKLLKEWNDWLFNIGAQEKVADKVELEGGVILNINDPRDKYPSLEDIKSACAKEDSDKELRTGKRKAGKLPI